MAGSVRVRVPELLLDRKMTAYELAKRSEGRISLSAAYRLCRAHGRFDRISADALAALCEVLRVLPTELLQRTR